MHHIGVWVARWRQVADEIQREAGRVQTADAVLWRRQLMVALSSGQVAAAARRRRASGMLRAQAFGGAYRARKRFRSWRAQSQAYPSLTKPESKAQAKPEGRHK